MRPLAVVVGISLVCVGVLGPLTLDAALHQSAATVRDLYRQPLGSSVLVEGLVEPVHLLNGGAALANLSDCAGAKVRVFFPASVGAPRSWSLVRVRATLQEFAGQRELSATASLPTSVSSPLPVDAPHLVADASPYLCRPIKVAAHVEAWDRTPGEPNGIEFVAREGATRFTVALHCDLYLSPAVEAGARLTFAGVPALDGPNGDLVLHVRA